MLPRAAIAIAALTPLSTLADELHVPSQYPSIQAAIDAAEHGDEIHIAPGTYRELLDAQNKSLTFIGAGTEETILSGDLDGDTLPDGNILDYDNALADVMPFFTITGITFADAEDAISFSIAADITITECDFQACEGGIIQQRTIDGSILARDVLVRDCDFYDGGSGVNISSAATITAERCTFRHQTSTSIDAHPDTATLREVLVDDCVRGGIALNVNQGSVTDCTFNRIQGYGAYSCLSVVSYDTFTIERSSFTNSNPDSNGPTAIVLRAAASPINVLDCLFDNNRGDFESAVSTIGPTRFQDCLFTNNIASGVGPINFYAIHDVPSTVTRCAFINNGRYDTDGQLFPFGGGGMCIEEGTVIVTDSLYRGNIAKSAGAIMITGSSVNCQINNCSFEANTAYGYRVNEAAGGAITGPGSRSRGIISITNSSFIGNEAVTGQGGAIHLTDSATITNCAFIDNESTHGTAVYLDKESPDPDEIPAPRASLFYNSLGSNSTLASLDGPYLPSQHDNLLFSDPIAFGFTRLPSHGGDGWGDDPNTPDIDESANDDFGDLHLRPHSPAIDAGDNAMIPRDVQDLDADGDTDEPLTGMLDPDGNPRFTDTTGMPDTHPTSGFAGPIDLGPYEFQGESCHADVNRDGTLTPADFSAWVDAFNTNDTKADQNRDSEISPTDFTAWVNNFNAGC